MAVSGADPARAAAGARLPHSGSASGIRRQLWAGPDERQIAQGDAGFQKSVTIMGGVGRRFPAEILQVPLDGEGGKLAIRTAVALAASSVRSNCASAAARTQSTCRWLGFR